MKYYPIFLDMKGRRCVVIGGGPVAERKVRGLLEAKAVVTVVSPTITEGLRSLVISGAIGHVARAYAAGDLNGYDLAFGATDDTEINESVFGEARLRRVWINSADDPEHCDFILPAVLRRGDLTVAVSTGGKSPALARSIKEDLETYFTEDTAALVEVAAQVRRELRDESVSASAEAWNSALSREFRRLVHDEKPEQAKELLLSKLGAKS